MQTYGNSFSLTFLTNKPAFAIVAEDAGIDRICIDLERIGKRERQPELNARISDHTISDIESIKKSIKKTSLIVRINPINPASQAEINAVIDSGADLLMLPFFRRTEEIEQFLGYTNGRARCTLLLETSSALARLEEITKIAGVEEIMVGLNDLHKELRLNNHFELLSSNLMNYISNEIRKNKIAFSFGGVGRVDDASFAVPSNLILPHYPLYKANGAWLSRSFLHGMDIETELKEAVIKLRNHLTKLSESPRYLLEKNRIKLKTLSQSFRF